MVKEVFVLFYFRPGKTRRALFMVFPATVELWELHCPSNGVGILGAIFFSKDYSSRLI